MLACDKHDSTITCVFYRDLHLTLIFSSRLQKDLLKKKVKFVAETQLWSRVSHKVCRLLSCPVLMRTTDVPLVLRNKRIMGDLECLRRRPIGLMADLTSSWENALLKLLSNMT